MAAYVLGGAEGQVEGRHTYMRTSSILLAQRVNFVYVYVLC